jgi:hypothetical protein
MLQRGTKDGGPVSRAIRALEIINSITSMYKGIENRQGFTGIGKKTN